MGGCAPIGIDDRDEDGDLLAQHPADNKPRLDQCHQVREALDETL
jgi:hypothetical protein